MVSSSKKNQNNKRNIMDIIEINLEPCQSNILYTNIQIALKKENIELSVLIDLKTRLNLIDKELVEKWKLTKKKLPKPLII